MFTLGAGDAQSGFLKVGRGVRKLGSGLDIWLIGVDLKSWGHGLLVVRTEHLGIYSTRGIF